MRKVSLSELNAADRESFVKLLGGIVEHSPWVANGAYDSRPFASLEELHEALTQTVREAGEKAQLALLHAHPDLAGRATQAEVLTHESRQEQSGAGLDRLSPDEYARFHRLNDRYQSKFDFPFILAVRGLDKHGILAAFEARLKSAREAEIETALTEVLRIARFRLHDLVRSR